MPIKKSAIKHRRQTIKRTSRNLAVKKNIKDILKKADKAIASGKIKDTANDLARDLQKAIDKAVKAKVLKANAGNRKKERFHKKLQKAGVKLTGLKKPAKTETK